MTGTNDRLIASESPSVDLGLVTALLDETHRSIVEQAPDMESRIDTLFDGLRSLKRDRSSRWSELSEGILKHPIRRLLHQDPFTRRSYEKPRGYAGDAVLLDYIYARDAGVELDDRIKRLFDYTTARPGPQAVRNRCHHIASLVDSIALREPARRLRVLSMACGHLREAGLSVATRDGAVECWTAIDHDADSLSVAAGAASQGVVRPIGGSVRDLVTGRIDKRLDGGRAPRSGYDLVYAAGLYDYLSEPMARRVTEWLVTCLRPGGEILLANFVPDVPDVGYMETFMAWNLIYRSRGDVEDLARSVTLTRLRVTESELDATSNIALVRAIRE